MTLHAILHNNNPFSFLTLTPWYLWSNEPDAVLGARELKRLLRLIPYARGIGGHTVRSYLNYEDTVGRPCQYITFMREPISRYLSHFNYQRQIMGKHWTIDSFLDDRRFANYMTVRLAGEPDVERAKQELERFAFVGIMERFDESLLLVRRALGNPNLCLYYARENPSRNLGYDAALDLQHEDVPCRLRECNALDLELYRFACERIYPRQVAEYGGELEKDLEAFARENTGFRFSRVRRLLWTVHRRFWQRQIEWLVHQSVRS